MEKEFKLSEKIFREKEYSGGDNILVEDIKTFIKLLKEDMMEADFLKMSQGFKFEEILHKRTGDLK